MFLVAEASLKRGVPRRPSCQSSGLLPSPLTSTNKQADLLLGTREMFPYQSSIDPDFKSKYKQSPIDLPGPVRTDDISGVWLAKSLESLGNKAP
jgi:hypothetical protein